MSFIKLKEFCDSRSISYITGYRWFKRGDILGAYKTDSGTILIPENFTGASKPDKVDAIALLLEKSLEFHNNEASVMDFTAYVLSNFKITLNEESDVPTYSKNKPKPEEIQNHFKKFLPKKDTIEGLKHLKDSIKERKQIIKSNDYTSMFEQAMNNAQSANLDASLDEGIADLKNTIVKLEENIPEFIEINEQDLLETFSPELAKEVEVKTEPKPKKRGRKTSKTGIAQ